NIITPEFFQTYGTRLLAGRDFRKTDGAGAPPVVIVNEAYVRKFMNGASPIGRTVRQAAFPQRPAVTREIVGYVEDAIYRNLRQTIRATIYIPIGQQPEIRPFVSVSVRSAAGSPALLTRAVADAFAQVSPELTLTFHPLAEQVRNSLIQ